MARGGKTIKLTEKTKAQLMQALIASCISDACAYAEINVPITNSERAREHKAAGKRSEYVRFSRRSRAQARPSPASSCCCQTAERDRPLAILDDDTEEWGVRQYVNSRPDRREKLREEAFFRSFSKSSTARTQGKAAKEVEVK